MRILVATDAWVPQVNGVVRSIEALIEHARPLGAVIDVLTPQGFQTVAMPTYPDIRLALARPSEVQARIAAARPDHIHIATEGPIGLVTRHVCQKQGRLFTTSYHTRFPEYVAARAPVPRAWTYAALRWFHNGGAATMAATDTVEADLLRHGFNRVLRWSRGVDHVLYRPRPTSVLDLPRPIHLSVGRVAVEKNIEAFLALDLPGSKVVVGDGPARSALQARYPEAHFLGVLTGESLAAAYASADVFVFPSRTDTFGIVLLEALASGVPVAAYPVPGPLDVIGSSGAGVLDDDLADACRRALLIPRERARAHAMRSSWGESARQFLDNVSAARATATARQDRSPRSALGPAPV